MPNFDEMYPHDDVQLDKEGDELLYVEVEKPCAKCSKSTHWLSINAFAYLCSTECYNNYWHDFAEAYNRR